MFVWVVLLLPILHVVQADDRGMHLLIFGGNGFIGADTAALLVHQGHTITLASRGRSWPWDTELRVKNYVKRHVKCDRYDPKNSCEELWELLKDPEQHFDAVIDFSAYKLRAVEPFYETLKKKADLYLYISTDSVYEVCEVPTDRPLKETDAVRPEDPEKRAELFTRDKYGHHKMEIEEFLEHKRKHEDGIPYVFLRLPDVLGQRDGTERFWRYQMWLEYEKQLGKPVQVPQFTRTLRTSYVYVFDVARAVNMVLNARPSLIRDQIYNLGFRAGKTLPELLNLIRSGLNNLHKDDPNWTALELEDLETPKTEEEEKEKVEGEEHSDGDIFLFPSVTRGTVDTSRIYADLKWTPGDSWEDTVGLIVEFYDDAKERFPKERDETAESLLEDLGMTGKEYKKQRKAFLNALRGEENEEDEEGEDSNVEGDTDDKNENPATKEEL